MKNKLITILALILLCGQTNLQAKWSDKAYDYYVLARYLIAEKIKEYNPFAQKEEEVTVSEPEAEKKVVKFKKKKRRRYSKTGKKLYKH